MADQLSNFLGIFRKTWQAGKDARLVVEFHAGQAWITLHQPIGLPPPPPIKQQQWRPGPYRVRRHARWAQAREAASASAETTTEKAVQTNKSSPLTLEAAVQVDIHLTPAPPQPQDPTASAVQAGPAAGQHRAEQAHSYPRTIQNFSVPDTLCPDTVYHSPATQVVPPHHHVTHQNDSQLDG